MWQSFGQLYERLDPFVRDGHRFTNIGVEANEALLEFAPRFLAANPDLVPIAKDQAEFMVVHEGAGVTTTPASLVASTFTAALEQMYYLGLPDTDAVYLDLVVKNLSALRQAGNGGKVELHEVIGLTGLELPQSRTLATPWGQLRGIKRPGFDYVGLDGWVKAITLVLNVPRRIAIPIVPLPVEQIAVGPWKTSEENNVLGLLALAFVVSRNADRRVAPVAVWTRTVSPFAPHGSYTVRSPLVPAIMRPTLNESDCVAVEGWCRLLQQHRHLKPGIHIAGARLVSAVSGRTDTVDRLIDAVVAWENLVGADSETTFRVTAGIAKLIEDDPSKRATLVRQLKDIYGLRSRAVHGADVGQNNLSAAADLAVEIGITALKRLYDKGPQWLTVRSSKRADRLLLEEP
jgi:Apea-like HEPN